MLSEIRLILLIVRMDPPQPPFFKLFVAEEESLKACVKTDLLNLWADSIKNPVRNGEGTNRAKSRHSSVSADSGYCINDFILKVRSIIGDGNRWEVFSHVIGNFGSQWDQFTKKDPF